MLIPAEHVVFCILNFNAHDSMKESCEAETENFRSSDIGKPSLTHWLLFSEFQSSWDCLCDVSHASVAFLIPFPSCCRSTPINRWKYLYICINEIIQLNVLLLIILLSDWLMDRWADWLTQWLTDWLMDGQIDWLTGWLTDWLTD